MIDSYLILSRALEEFEVSWRRKDFLVGVGGVDDQAHQLLDVGIEGEISDMDPENLERR